MILVMKFHVVGVDSQGAVQFPVERKKTIKEAVTNHLSDYSSGKLKG